MSDPATSIPKNVRADWNARAEGWTNTATRVAASGGGYNQRMIEAAGIEPGHRVVDLASGAGEPAVTIASHVGPGGRVTATDAAWRMLDGARDRAAAMGLTNLDFVVADMAALPYADASFDALTCRFGLMFPPDAVAAAGEARRVLKPGGRAVYMVHGAYEDAPLYRTVRETALAFFGRQGSPTANLRERFAAPGALSAVLKAAGFSDVEDHPVQSVAEHPADAAFWRTSLERRYAADLKGLDDAGRGELDRRMKDAFAPYLGDGVYRLVTVDRIGFGTAE